MASIRFQRRHNPLKARLLAPFVPKYRLRSRIAAMPEPIQLIIRQVVLSDDNRLLFVRNFKSGCTTVSHLIYERDKGHRYDGNISDAPDLIRGIPYLDKVEPALADPSIYRFTMVRHPVSRAVSAFRDFVVDRRNRESARHLPALREFGLRDGDPASAQFDVFLSFIEACRRIDPAGTDPHFRTQVMNTAFGTMRYDRICRIENYAEDVSAVFREAGLAVPESLGKMRMNSSSPQDFELSPRQVERLHEVYADDFEAFGY